VLIRTNALEGAVVWWKNNTSRKKERYATGRTAKPTAIVTSSALEKN
jgi:hypothetical protein